MILTVVKVENAQDFGKPEQWAIWLKQHPHDPDTARLPNPLVLVAPEPPLATIVGQSYDITLTKCEAPPAPPEEKTE